jgi:uncharacterized protein
VTVVIDAAPLVAFGDANDPQFTRIEELLRTIGGPLIIPAPVTAEVDYLLGQRVGRGPRRNFIADLAAVDLPLPVSSERTTPRSESSTRAIPISSLGSPTARWS